MDITLHITIPDQIIMEGVEPPNEEEYEKLVHDSLANKINITETRAKGVVNKSSSDIAKQSEEADKNYQHALDTLSNIVAASAP